MYYGAGALSNYDKYCEQKKPVVAPSRGLKKRMPRDDLCNRSLLYPLDAGDNFSVSWIQLTFLSCHKITKLLFITHCVKKNGNSESIFIFN